jgi:hypothetical protein
MMSKSSATSLESLVYVEDVNGVTVIPQLSELRRLNWFDGKLLRADDLRIEQDHARALVRRSNRAGGQGAVQGMTCTLGTDAQLHVAPGTAIDPGGRPLLLPVAVALDIAQLIDRTAAIAAKTDPAAGANGFAECVAQQIAGLTPVAGARWYVITVGWVDGLCGTETAYGNLCEDACTTSTARPWRMDGLVFRARPIQPVTALATSSAILLGPKHERSQLASALFADEQAAGGSLISAAGLRSPIWCMGAAPTDPLYDEVPLAVIGRQGETTTFLDAWTARRERIEPPPQRYWATRTSMRPWDVFLAQVLQFQCQLSDLVIDAPAPGAKDPCSEHQQVLQDAIAALQKRPPPREPGKPQMPDDLLKKLTKQVQALGQASNNTAGSHALIDGGIIELPPAGYLPVDPASGPVEDQIRALLGAGVDLTFCTTRHDAVARALEEAQHLDRISLLRGLDNTNHREDIEIIIPDAEIEEITARDTWNGQMKIRTTPPTLLDGAGRIDARNELVLKWAGAGDIISEDQVGGGAAGIVGSFVEANVGSDPFSLEGQTVTFSASGDLVYGTTPDETLRGALSGTLHVDSINEGSSGIVLNGTIIQGLAEVRDGTDGKDDRSLTLDELAVTLTRSTVADGEKVGITSPEIPNLTAELAWGDTANTVEITALTRRSAAESLLANRDALQAEPASAQQAQDPAPGPLRPVATLTMQRDPDAASPGNPARTGAESGLNALEDIFDKPGYAGSAAKRLFPEADEPPRSHLHATPDWVLFRRRAILRYGMVPVPVTTESFAVYGLLDTDLDESATFLGLLRFRAGSAELLEGADGVASSWDDLAHGGVMQAAGIFTGSPGPESLWRTRTGRLVEALAGITPPIPGMTVFIVDPDNFLELDPRGADGVMVVKAKVPVAPDPPVTTDSFAVYGSTNSWVSLTFLGLLRFRAGTDELLDGAGDVASAWDNVAHGGTMDGVGIVTGSPGMQDLWLTRTAQLVKALAGVTPTPGLLTEIVIAGPLADLDPRGADGVMVVKAKMPPAEVEVAVVAVDPKSIKAVSKAPTPKEEIAAIFKVPRVLGIVHFPVNSTVAPEPELKAVDQAYTKAIGDLPRAALTVYSRTDEPSPDSTHLRVERAFVVSRASKGTATRISSVTEDDLQAARSHVTQNTIVVVTPDPPVTARVIAVHREPYRATVTSDVAAGVKEALGGNSRYLGNVRFDPGTAQEDLAQVINVKKNWLKFAQDTGLAGLAHVDVIVLEEDATFEDRDKARGKVVAQRLVEDPNPGVRRFEASSLPGVNEQMLIVVVPPAIPA